MILITRDRDYNMANADALSIDNTKYGSGLVLYMHDDNWLIARGKEGYIRKLKEQIGVAWAQKESMFIVKEPHADRRKE